MKADKAEEKQDDNKHFRHKHKESALNYGDVWRPRIQQKPFLLIEDTTGEIVENCREKSKTKHQFVTPTHISGNYLLYKPHSYNLAIKN